MAFSGMINVKSGQLTLRGQFEAYKRGQLERNIHHNALNHEKKLHVYYRIGHYNDHFLFKMG